MHPRGEHACEGERDQSADEQHDKGGDELPLTQFDEGEINLRERQGEANNDRGAGGAVVTLRTVNEFAVEGGAPAHGLARAACEGLLNFGAIRVVFHFFGVGFGIREDAASIVNDGYARAAARGSAGPVAEFDGVIGLRGIRESEAEKRGELVIGGTYCLAADDARGIELHGEQDDEEQGAIGEAELPEKSSSHGFRTDIRRRGLFS